MRIGLGCMRLSTDPERDEARARATLHAALDAGLTTLDTARAYGRDASEDGHNERLIASVLAERYGPRPRVITKCGMRRDGAAWIPDGRASRIRSDARASAAALGRPLDLLLLHVPDPRTSLGTAARALARVHAEGLALRVGVSNVTRKQLEELASIAPITAVETALGAYDDLAVRSGVVAFCLEQGLELLAHAPLGGPERALRLSRDRVLREVSAAHPSKPTPAEVVLAYLLAVKPTIVPVVGARRPATIASLVRAEELQLTEDQLALLDARFPVLGALRKPPERGPSSGAEVVLLMGVPGAGKSSAAAAYVARGYERLNRDTLGGTLRGVVRLLDDRLRDGARRVVLDNTYVARAARSDVLRVAHARGASVHCVYFATPTREAEQNIVQRMIQRFGHVLEPHELAALGRSEPTALAPAALLRMTRDLEPPTGDEGFASIETTTFVRDAGPPLGRRGMTLPLDALDDAAREVLLGRLAEEPPDVALLLHAWRPGVDDVTRDQIHAFAASMADPTGRVVEATICDHPAGPPVCWCRPPLPGPWVAFAHRHGLVGRVRAPLRS